MSPAQDPTLRDMLKVISRRRRIVFVVFAISLFVALAICIFSTRMYRASSTIKIEKSSSDGLNLEGLMGDAGGGMSDSLTVNLDLQTQKNVLECDALALKVIQDMSLEETADFKPSVNHLGVIIGLADAFGRDEQESARAPLEDSPRRRMKALRTFHNNLHVKVVAGTRLIEVDYDSSDPKLAADVVNHLVRALVDFNFQTKFKATNDVSQWLQGQISDIRKQDEALQARVVQLQKETGLFGVGADDMQGRPIIYSPTLSNLQQSTTDVGQAQINRILKGSVYETVKSGDAELISQLSGNGLGGGVSQGVSNSLTVLQTLRTNEATLRQQIAQDSAKFGEAYPKLVEERAALEGIHKSIKEESARLASRARNDYESAIHTEQGARKLYQKNRADAEKLNDKTIEYNILQHEAVQSQALYQDLLKKLKGAGILEGLHATNITVIDPGRRPWKPNSPKMTLDLALGMAFGLFFGICGAFLSDSLDTQIHGPDDIESTQLPLMGVLPRKDAGGGIALQSRPFLEAMRTLRSSVLISRSGAPPNVILVSSAAPGEGKSTIALHLAASLAQFDKRVLLVDADLRRPTVEKMVGVAASTGLSKLLSNKTVEPQPVSVPDSEYLKVVTAGPIPPYPAELLGGPRMSELINLWREQFDFVVIDSPPVLAVADARILMPHADTTLLVARVAVTSKLGIQRSYHALLPHAENPDAPAIGVVLNDISLKSPSYYGYYGYSSSQYGAYYGIEAVKKEGSPR